MVSEWTEKELGLEMVWGGNCMGLEGSLRPEEPAKRMGKLSTSGRLPVIHRRQHPHQHRNLRISKKLELEVPKQIDHYTENSDGIFFLSFDSSPLYVLFLRPVTILLIDNYFLL